MQSFQAKFLEITLFSISVQLQNAFEQSYLPRLNIHKLHMYDYQVGDCHILEYQISYGSPALS